VGFQRQRAEVAALAITAPTRRVHSVDVPDAAMSGLPPAFARFPSEKTTLHETFAELYIAHVELYETFAALYETFIELYISHIELYISYTELHISDIELHISDIEFYLAQKEGYVPHIAPNFAKLSSRRTLAVLLLCRKCARLSQICAGTPLPLAIFSSLTRFFFLISPF
jgi:hypothetical protein